MTARATGSYRAFRDLVHGRARWFVVNPDGWKVKGHEYGTEGEAVGAASGLNRARLASVHEGRWVA